MISKLPRWVEYGAFVLALVAGFINSVGFLGFSHQSISHLSGIATMIGTSIADASFISTLHLLGVILSFLAGSTLSGFFLRGGALRLGRNYSRLLLLEALFILGAIYFLTKDALFGHYLASAACGLQNALVTTFSGAVVRTTHVTGIFTDLGLMIGARLRGEAFDKRKALLFMLIISGFILGGVFGTFAYSALMFEALFIPAAICLVLAVAYSIFNAKAGKQHSQHEL
ncbi:YoaK family protein [Shewanella sp. UCD-KL21]|uniref:YoaK family protein n=1 Tax=Shewanella sp. UCD-KL21 TaxID=1917164 RepID=UPI00097085E0|nr:YoaK family protein [Shewanella sp. UCD-KL21]